MSDDHEQPIAFVLSAPSGAGKTTLATDLLARVDRLRKTVSYTTREPRKDETDGVDYTFVSVEDFERRRAAGEFLECAEVHDHLYGTPRAELERIHGNGNDALMVIDVQGAAEVRKELAGAATIFVLPRSRETLERRLEERDGSASQNEAEIHKRLGVAAEEIAQFVKYDYVVINDDFDAAVDDLEAIVIAERCRRLRRVRSAQAILESFR